MTAELRRHIRAPGGRFAVLTEIDHPHGLLNLWTGSGRLDYDGKVWEGVGHISAISGATETSEVIVSEVRSTLSHVRQSDLRLVEVSIKGRRQSIWWAGMTADRRVVPDPIQISEVDLDYPVTTTDERGVHSITLVGQTGFWVLERSSQKAWTPEQQAIKFPTDTGFDFMHTMRDKEVQWTKT